MPATSMRTVRSMPPTCAGPARDRLSLALMDSRNQTLAAARAPASRRWPRPRVQVPCEPGFELPHWLAGHIAWFAEWWIARNPRRGLGRACPADAPRLPPIAAPWPTAGTTRCSRRTRAAGTCRCRPWTKCAAYLLETLERTLDLLEQAAPDDDGLYFFRAALFHEDLRGEQLVRQAQALGLPCGRRCRRPACRASRCCCPPRAGCWARSPGRLRVRRRARAARGGGARVRDRRAAGQLGASSWSSSTTAAMTAPSCGIRRAGPGWQRWAQGEGRRGPRHVDQIGVASGAVMQTRVRPPDPHGARTSPSCM